MRIFKNFFSKKNKKFVFDINQLEYIGRKYLQEINEAERLGSKTLHIKEDRDVNIDFNCLGAGEEIESILEELKAYKINLVDSERIKLEKESIRNRYEREFGPGVLARASVGGTLPEWFIGSGWYFFTIFIGQWLLRHILNDLDEGAWQGVKKIIFSLYSFARRKSTKKSDEFVIITAFFSDISPTILFKINTDLSDENVMVALSEISMITKKVLGSYDKKGKQIYRFLYNKKESRWNLINE